MTAAASAPKNKLMTYEEYVQKFRNGPPRRQPHFILDGVLIMPPSPVPLHQRIVYRLGALLNPYEEGGILRVFPSPLDVIIRRSPLRTRQPDLLVISEATYSANGGIDLNDPITIAPELVVEVLSPIETARTLNGKIADYREIGVQECWILRSLDGTVEVLSLSAETPTRVGLYTHADVIRSDVFQDLNIPVEKIFS